MTTENFCKECCCVNTLDSSNLIRKEVYDKDKNYYKLIYFKCKHCGEINVVQIDDMETIHIYRDLKSLILKAMKKRMKNQTISPKDVKKKDTYTKRLNEKRLVLVENTDGFAMYNPDGSIFVDSLSIRKGGMSVDDSM